MAVIEWLMHQRSSLVRSFLEKFDDKPEVAFHGKSTDALRYALASLTAILTLAPGQNVGYTHKTCLNTQLLFVPIDSLDGRAYKDRTMLPGVPPPFREAVRHVRRTFPGWAGQRYCPAHFISPKFHCTLRLFKGSFYG